jgi:hypothetical protein
MNAATTFSRPSLGEALDAWNKTLKGRNFSTDLLWLFEENLCFEKSRPLAGGFRFGFQTKFTPPPEDALDIAYYHFSESDARIVFYRLGESGGRSVCILLCDRWFAEKDAGEGYLRHDDWNISFHPGQLEQIEEVTDLTRWLHRVRHGRAYHDLDFCMTLEAAEEIRIHGRPLAPYEHFAGTMLNRLRRIHGNPA